MYHTRLGIEIDAGYDHAQYGKATKGLKQESAAMQDGLLALDVISALAVV